MRGTRGALLGGPGGLCEGDQGGFVRGTRGLC